MAPHDHAVSFYDHEGEIVAGVARYVGEGLVRGERAVVVATGGHRAALDEALLGMGVDAPGARRSGHYVVLDAAETLASFMVDDMPDAAKFVEIVGGVVGTARADGSTVRAFGEMVALLWEIGNVAAAIELESLWNDLARHEQFTLLCAYPTTALDGARLSDVSRVCDEHSSVLPPSSYQSTTALDAADAADRERSELFVPVPEAVPAARRFVVATLEQWGEDALASDAALVTSELATNAVRHGASPFRAVVSRDSGVVRVAIEDVGPGWPELRAATARSCDGRGVAIVEAVAARAGCDALADGKIAWAEFEAQTG